MHFLKDHLEKRAVEKIYAGEQDFQFVADGEALERISTVEDDAGDVDRVMVSTRARKYGLILLDPEGIQFQEYLETNPIVLYMHAQRELTDVDFALAKTRSLQLTGEGVEAEFQWYPWGYQTGSESDKQKDLDFLHMQWKLRYLNAASIGVRFLKVKERKDLMKDDDFMPPIDVLQARMNEFSIVTIGADPKAVRRQFSYIIKPTLVKKYERKCRQQVAKQFAKAEKAKQKASNEARVIAALDGLIERL